MIQQPISTVCGSCGLYLPGHATRCQDICTCSRANFPEPLPTLYRLVAAAQSAICKIESGECIADGDFKLGTYLLGDFIITDVAD